MERRAKKVIVPIVLIDSFLSLHSVLPYKVIDKVFLIAFNYVCVCPSINFVYFLLFLSTAPSRSLFATSIRRI